MNEWLPLASSFMCSPPSDDPEISQISINSTVTEYSEWKHEIQRFLEQVCFSEVSLNARQDVFAPALHLAQVLAAYRAQSLREDVPFFFTAKIDWRIGYLMPEFETGTRAGLVMANLFVALHRLVSVSTYSSF